MNLASHTSSETPSSVTIDTLIAATSQIVSAYIVNRPTDALNINALTADVFANLRQLALQEATAMAASTRSAIKPVVAVEESVKGDYLVCLEDGKRVKMLKRYLRSRFNLSPEEYRRKWGLPPEYPMVAPVYAARRSDFAKKIGLGRGVRGRKA